MKIADIISSRWSPRAFTDDSLTEEDINSLFEAARWAPSSMNEQPWRYIYARKEDAENFAELLDCLVPGNQEWARNASVLILSIARRNFDYKNLPNRHAIHDLGAANLLICLQANEMGFQAHQMGGFNMNKTLEKFSLESDKYEPVSFIAVGKEGDATSLPEDLRQREIAPRKRKSLNEIFLRN